MIYTVTLNPSLDYIVNLNSLRLGQVNRTEKECINPGGKGINVSLVLGNLGFDNTALGFLAGFTGDEIARQMEERGVRADFVRIQDGFSRVNIKLRSREESEINGRGPVIGEEDIRLLYRRLDDLKDGDILVLAGSIPSSVPASIYMDIMKYLEDREVLIAVDATRELLLNVLPFHPFLIKPNHHELGEIFGRQIEGKRDVIYYAGKLRENGARNVMVSMAGEGAVLVTEDGDIYEREAPQGKVINSVGAGDSMVAGFLAGFIESGDYERAFAMGVCTGSASAFSEGLATREMVEKIMKEQI